MIRRYGVLLAAITILLIAVATIIFKKHHSTGSNNMLPVAIHTMPITGGWGYEVLVDNKVYIHQDCIPAIPSFKPFRTETEALLAANMVVDKIKHGHKPALTVEEIQHAHIQY